MTPVITLLICDDHRLLTDALVHIVSSDDGIKLVADPVDNAEEAVALCAAHRPDVVLMDIELRGAVNGIEATRQVKAVSPLTKVVVVSGHRRRTVAVEAVEAGAAGFLDKNVCIDDLLDTIRAAAAGEVLVDPAVLASLLPELAAQRQVAGDAKTRLARLTAREREILDLMASGCRNEAIAARLFISPPTVRTHAQNILSKLGVHSQLEPVALAARNPAEPR